ncbi:hypothetical protein JD844_006077, partial [Phrynosoma platyrhinos]
VTGATSGIGKGYAHEVSKLSKDLIRFLLKELVYIFQEGRKEKKQQACCLAKRGLDVVLISRSMEKLKRVATKIEEQYGRRTKVIQADFTGGSEIYESIQAALQGLEIGILVNNVGMSQEVPQTFLRHPDVDKYVDDLVNCNMLSVVKAFVDFFSRALDIEYRSKGIIVQYSIMRQLFPVWFQESSVGYNFYRYAFKKLI